MRPVVWAHCYYEAISMHKRTERLHNIMSERGLSCRDVGRLLGRTEQTVLIWRCKSDNKIIPEHQLELLELKLGVGGDHE